MRLAPLSWSLLALTLSIGFVPAAAIAEEPPPPPPYEANVAPVYVIIAFDDTFNTGPSPTRTILVKIGALVGGDGILDTRFAVDQELSQIVLPPEQRYNPTFEDFLDNSSTVLGSFSTTSLGEVHMVTPAPGTIAPDIQLAVFSASNEGLLDELILAEDFPTTIDIAEVIASRLPEGSPTTVAEIVTAVFGSAVTMTSDDFGLSVTSEGEMFPHDPDATPLFRYSLNFNEEGDFESDVCLLVGIDIHPGSRTNQVDLEKKKGKLPVAILSSDTFDARDVDACTVHIGGVFAYKSSVEDVDCDGDKDLVLHWKVRHLVDDGVLDADTTELTVEGTLDDGSCIVGTDIVTIKEKKKKKCSDEDDDEDEDDDD